MFLTEHLHMKTTQTLQGENGGDSKSLLAKCESIFFHHLKSFLVIPSLSLLTKPVYKNWSCIISVNIEQFKKRSVLLLRKLERVSVLQELDFIGEVGKVNMSYRSIWLKKQNEAPRVKCLALCLVYKEIQYLQSEWRNESGGQKSTQLWSVNINLLFQ